MQDKSGAALFQRTALSSHIQSTRTVDVCERGGATIMRRTMYARDNCTHVRVRGNVDGLVLQTEARGNPVQQESVERGHGREVQLLHTENTHRTGVDSRNWHVVVHRSIDQLDGGRQGLGWVPSEPHTHGARTCGSS